MTTALKKRQKLKGETLTADELAVLREIATSAGPYSDVARQLGTSSSAINSAMHGISRKIGVRRRHGLTIYAYQNGLVDVQSIQL